MAEPLLECVPNVSEGRDTGVLARLAAMVETAGARLLDVHSDPDHHRSVFTFLGPPEAVERAAFALGCAAVDAIDLRRHTGVHPRIGSLDVLPFVPLAGTTMAEAVTVARRVGTALADARALPVFFYEEAASDPARRDLPVLRAGGFERLTERLAQPGWRPDAGPAAPHPSAGAAVVGARRLLIALNAELEGADLGAAQAIARAVRASSGGLPGVRALGLALPSRAIVQVSMNLIDYRRTPPALVMARVDEEAARRGTRVRRWELVGCAPDDALPDAVAARIPALEPSQRLDPTLLATAG